MGKVLNLVIDRAFTPPPVKRWVGWRGLHRVEGGREPAYNSPGVIPPYTPTVKLKMTKDIQLMSYDLAAHFHPAIRVDRNKWRIIHGGAFAMNNGPWNGYDHPIEPHPLRDYVNGRDLIATYPYYDKMQRTYAGSLITGQKVNDLIWCQPGIDAIDARDFAYVPGTPEAAITLAEILERGWFVFAVAEGETSPFKIRPQWGDGLIVFPFILDRAVSFESRFFVFWDEAYLPDPLKVYV